MNRQLQRQIVSLRKGNNSPIHALEQLSALCWNNLAVMDTINSVTAMHSMANIMKGLRNPRKGSFRPGNSMTQITSSSRLFNDLAEKVVTDLTSSSAVPTQCISNSLWACATSGLYHKPLFEHAAHYIVHHMQQCNSTDAATILWAFGRFRFQHEAAIELLARSIASSPSSLKPPELSNTFWALSQLKHNEPAILDALCGLLHSSPVEGGPSLLASLENRHIVTILRALAHANYPNRAVAMELLTELQKRVPKVSARDAVEALWAVATLMNAGESTSEWPLPASQLIPPLLETLKTKVQDIEPVQLGLLLHSLSHFFPLGEALFLDALSEFEARTRTAVIAGRSARRPTARTCAMVLLACARVQEHRKIPFPTTSFRGKVKSIVESTLPNAADLNTAISSQCLQAMASLKLDVPEAVQTHSDIVASACKRQSELSMASSPTPHELSTTLWALGQLKRADLPHIFPLACQASLQLPNSATAPSTNTPLRRSAAAVAKPTDSVLTLWSLGRLKMFPLSLIQQTVQQLSAHAASFSLKEAAMSSWALSVLLPPARDQHMYLPEELQTQSVNFALEALSRVSKATISVGATEHLVSLAWAAVVLQLTQSVSPSEAVTEFIDICTNLKLEELPPASLRQLQTVGLFASLIANDGSLLQRLAGLPSFRGRLGLEGTHQHSLLKLQAVIEHLGYECAEGFAIQGVEGLSEFFLPECNAGLKVVGPEHWVWNLPLCADDAPNNCSDHMPTTEHEWTPAAVKTSNAKFAASNFLRWPKGGDAAKAAMLQHTGVKPLFVPSSWIALDDETLAHRLQDVIAQIE